MRFGKISGLAIACAALAASAWSGSAVAKTAPEAAPPAPKEPKAEAARIDEFVEANLAFILLHEMGHALISELELPVLGRQEDAADRLAAYLMTQSQPMEKLFQYAIVGWFARAEQTKPDEIQWWGRHSPDQQRATDAVCLLYGSDPPRFKALADEYSFPKALRGPCVDDAKSNAKSWFEMLSPNMVAGNAEDRARVPPAGPEFITIDYAESRDYKADREFLIRTGLLEEVRNGFRRNFMVRPGISLTARECTEPNAFWSAEERRLTICYELVRQYRDMASQPRRK